MSETLETLRKLVQDKFDIDAARIEPEVSILDSGLDSLALTELLFAVEEKFGVELLDVAREITTLGGLARLIDDLRSRAQPATASPTGLPIR